MNYWNYCSDKGLLVTQYTINFTIHAMFSCQKATRKNIKYISKNENINKLIFIRVMNRYLNMK